MTVHTLPPSLPEAVPMADAILEKKDGVSAAKPTPSRMLHAETGMLNAVTIEQAEGYDPVERQDAPRTPSEISPGTEAVALIVEDTLELAEILATTLRKMGIRTIHESHGNRAFSRFNQLRPDILLLDIGLPDISGWQVLDTLKEQQQQAGEYMPAVIVISAFGDPANRLVGKLQGVYSYLVKPFTPTEVEAVVQTALMQASRA